MRNYQLSVDGFPADHFRVHSFKGNETISEAWWFDVVVTAPAGDDVERAALAQRATLIFNVGETPRAFYGVVAAVHLAEVHAVDHAVKYVVRVVPRLWLLRRKTRTRVFQKMRVPDIVSAVLLEAGITTRWQLVRAYPEREYCTQYEETDGGEPEHSAWRAFPRGSPSSRVSATTLYGTRGDAKIVCTGNRPAMGGAAATGSGEGRGRRRPCRRRPSPRRALGEPKARRGPAGEHLARRAPARKSLSA